MKTVRRLYFYAVALISLEVVLWGLIGLIRSIVGETVGGGVEALASALALILVGVPIFLVHWLWAQRASARDEEEKNASLRAIFLYAVMFGTLIPVVQNLLALINRSLVQASRLAAERALIGGQQTLADNSIAVIMNVVVAAYFWSILRNEWQTITDRESFADVRRLYRYLWVAYGLLMMIFGAQQVLRFIFYVPSNVLGIVGRETLVNGMALLVIGTPIWFYCWRIIQDSISDPAERESNLRLGFLYLLALGGVITVLSTASALIQTIIVQLLGAKLSTGDLIYKIGSPISIGVPLAAVWAYYGHWLDLHIKSIGDPVRQSGMKRVYFYILSALGLGVSIAGVASLINFIIRMFTENLAMDDFVRQQVAIPISLLIAWLPLWLLTWRPMQSEALAQGDAGDHARRSIVRKGYLYLALFAGVIGGMISAVSLMFELFRALLTGTTQSDFLSNILNSVQVLILFGVVLIYHLNILRRDGESTADALAQKQSGFSLLIVDSGDGFVESVQAMLMKHVPNVKVTVANPNDKPDGNFNALIMSGSAAINASEWIRSFSGNRLIVQDDAVRVYWNQDTRGAAQIVRALAEGQEVRPQSQKGRSAWMTVVYVAAALFGILMLFLLLTFAISLIQSF